MYFHSNIILFLANLSKYYAINRQNYKILLTNRQTCAIIKVYFGWLIARFLAFTNYRYVVEPRNIAGARILFEFNIKTQLKTSRKIMAGF